MGTMHLGKMTLRSMFKKPETTLYPFEKKSQPVGLKGQVVCDPETCILCGMCMRNCPTDSITVSREDRTWAINHYSCVQCYYCVNTCPKSCLAMLPDYPAVVTQKTLTVIEVPDKPKAAASADGAAVAKAPLTDEEKAARREAALKLAAQKKAERKATQKAEEAANTDDGAGVAEPSE